MKYRIGEFEEVVMLTIGILNDNAYGVSIREEIKSRLDRNVSVGALQATLRRMEKKGYLKSVQGETSDKRGGRPKLYFRLTSAGHDVLRYSRDSRNELWEAIPHGELGFGAAQ